LIVDYIGIGDKLRDATKKYTSSGGKGNITIDTEEAFEMATEFIATLKFKLPKDFNYDKWLSLSKGDQLKLVSHATNYILSDETRSKEFSGKVFNGYVYYLNRRHVIDAMPYKKALARFANDANGPNKIENLKNNSKFIIQQNKVYIQVVKDICAGEEILVPYGREYWKVIAENNLTSKKIEI